MTPYWRSEDGRIEVWCQEALSVLAQLPDRSVDAIITDPPYSSGGMFRSDRQGDVEKKYLSDPLRIYPTFGGDARDQRSYLLWCNLWMEQCLRIAKPGATLQVFSDWRQLPIVCDAIQVGGWVWRGVTVWDKSEAARPQSGRFRNQCEYVVWGSNGPMPSEGECLPGYFRCVVRQDDKHHITGKPTALLRSLVQICPRGGVVLDPFAGSGTTPLACQLEGRGCIAIERERAYVDVAIARLTHGQGVLDFGAEGAAS